MSTHGERGRQISEGPGARQVMFEFSCLEDNRLRGSVNPVRSPEHIDSLILWMPGVNNQASYLQYDAVPSGGADHPHGQLLRILAARSRHNKRRPAIGRATTK